VALGARECLELMLCFTIQLEHRLLAIVVALLGALLFTASLCGHALAIGSNPRHARAEGGARSSSVRRVETRAGRDDRQRRRRDAPAPPVLRSTLAGSVPLASQEATQMPRRFFSDTSVWNEPLARDAPEDPASAAAVAALSSEVALELRANRGPWISTRSWSVPIYTVPASQPTVTVRIVDNWVEPSLQSAWSSVPLPADALPARGTDRHLVVWQPGTDRMWEFWRIFHLQSGWQAAWGGAIQNASTSSGVFGPDAWPGAEPWWGATASSLPLVGGLITLADLRRGRIEHALSIALPKIRAGVFASPAGRDDGTSPDPTSLPEGARLRLDPRLNLDSLDLPPLTRMIAEAAQRYGIFVRDTGGDISFYAQDPTGTATEPYSGRHGYFEGKYPDQLLSSFPWADLEVMKMELHANGYGSR
jgi:hypothetical protein